MAQSVSGVIAVGALSSQTTGSPTPSARMASGNALLAAAGAWLVGVDAAICSAIPPDFPIEVIRAITRANLDLSRVRLVSSAEAARGQLDPLPEQLASVGESWAVHVLGLPQPRQRQLLQAVSDRVALVTVDAGYDASTPADPEDIFRLGLDSDAIFFDLEGIAPIWPAAQPRDVLRLLAGSGARAAVIRLGRNGSIGIYEDAIMWMPAFPITKTHRWPGGDAYAGAFAAIYLPTRDLTNAMAWATAAASAVIESQSPLKLLNTLGRRTVAARAKLLRREVEPG